MIVQIKSITYKSKLSELGRFLGLAGLDFSLVSRAGFKAWLQSLNDFENCTTGM